MLGYNPIINVNDGITLEDCMKVSRHIEENLDRDVEDFKLTVCSPGLENPFIGP